MAKVKEVIKVATVENDKGGYLELTAKDETGKTKVERVFGKMKDSFKGLGKYEFAYTKKEVGDKTFYNVSTLNYVGPLSAGSAASNGNGNGSSSYAKDPETQVQIMASVILKEASAITQALIAAKHLTAGKDESIVAVATATVNDIAVDLLAITKDLTTPVKVAEAPKPVAPVEVDEVPEEVAF